MIPTFAKPGVGLLNLAPLSTATLKIVLIALIELLMTLGAYLPRYFVNQDRNSGSPSFRRSIVRASCQLFSMQPQCIRKGRLAETGSVRCFLRAPTLGH